MITRIKQGMLIFLVACLLISCTNTAKISASDKVNTSVAQTVAAAQPTGGLPLPDGAVQPTNPAPPPVEQPTTTPPPLPTLAPSIPTLPPSPTTDTCNQAKFVQDVTIPDGTKITPGLAFTKTWRIQNTGTCSWNTAYAVVFDSGHSSGAPTVTPLPANVPPGGTIDVSVVITAPTTSGDYTWKFMLRSDTGRIFGFGAGYAYPMTAVIKVEPLVLLTALPHFTLIPIVFPKYDFTANYCSATWSNGHQDLPCPGTKNDSTGFVVQQDKPRLQDGNTRDTKSLLTHPEWVDGGAIVGIFPAVSIESGNRFKTTIGCGYSGTSCDVLFRVNYKKGSDPFVELGTWSMKYSNAPLDIDIDLSSLAGSDVKFQFIVFANGSSSQDWAHWVFPRIAK